jgi:chemotaxis protein methyltransferase CheR
VLEPDGVLALGAAESVVGISDAFRSCPERRGLYRPNVTQTARAGVTAMTLSALKAFAAAAAP